MNGQYSSTKIKYKSKQLNRIVEGTWHLYPENKQGVKSMKNLINKKNACTTNNGSNYNSNLSVTKNSNSINNDEFYKSWDRNGWETLC